MKTHKQEIIKIRRSQDRGHAQHGWLDSYHTFSFADYYDANFMGFRSLRVINEDKVAPAEGFGTHEHRDMEIISYVIEGALEHKDSMGNGSVIQPGNFQKITAGKGITHSEFNHSDIVRVHFLQIWITPDRKNIKPSYQEMKSTAFKNKGPLYLVGSKDGHKKSMIINQDALLYFGNMKRGEDVDYPTNTERGLWLQIISGELTVEENDLKAGDALSAENVSTLKITAKSPSQFFLFDLK